MRTGRPLPRASEAIIDVEGKLRGYSLNPGHESGGPKARVFESVLGFGPEDAEVLAERIRAALPGALITKINRGVVTTYEVLVKIRGHRGIQAIVTTAWAVPRGQPPRLVTAYIET